jgi:hypothetical protein
MQQMLCIVVATILYITILENVRSNGNCELYISEAFWPWQAMGTPSRTFLKLKKEFFRNEVNMGKKSN